ncbi:FtsK/SpoIIIE family DNA translocase [Helicobacter mehlei]|uniref:FtsK/SpoIIIE family DNA translocase n=1 Tax=Helicobacter mehlei TaxID=2316080 RepID=UPI0013CE1834|nr:DNA translocase FtsK [Helicobacter mehlei]
MGTIGQEVARFNTHYFGYVGYLNVFYLYYIVTLARRATLKALEHLLASLIAFLTLLFIQALVFQKGMVGVILTGALKVYIGSLGVWVCILCMGIWAWATLMPSTYQTSKTWLYQFGLQAPSRLKKGLKLLNNALKNFFEPKPSPLKSWQAQNPPQTQPPTPKEPQEEPPSSPLKIKVSYYSQENQDLCTQQVQLVSPSKSTSDPAKPTPPNSAYMDLVQQRRALEDPIETTPITPLKSHRIENHTLPSTDLLNPIPEMPLALDLPQMEQKSQQLLDKLRMFKIEGVLVSTHVGPVVSTFELRPAPHIKVSKILALADDLAMALCAPSIRIQAPIKGKDVMGIEIANPTPTPICLKEILESEAFRQAPPLALALGKDVVGQPYVSDLKSLPHLLIAGTTGSGKSVGMHAMILSLLFKNTPDQLQLIIIDPKRVEFSLYADIPHLRAPIITTPQEAIEALENAVCEMECRYTLLNQQRVKNIESYHAKAQAESMPFLVIMIDELADLMVVGGKDVETPIMRIAQMGRASGIHLIIATQRPSVDVLTGVIKTNLPCKISFKVGSKVDSRVILDTEGAQSLLGKGDMLFTPPGSNALLRLHAPYVTEEEVERVVHWICHNKDVSGVEPS